MQLMKAEAIILKLTEGLKNNNTNNNIIQKNRVKIINKIGKIQIVY